MKPEVTPLEKLWLEYRNACYPARSGKLSPLQEAETRQAFYAGCLVVIATVVETAIKSTGVKALEALEALMNEAQLVCRERVHQLRGHN